MSLKDHYKILEISSLASAAEIKQAYRNLARKYHPDKNNEEEKATRIFQEIQAAYEILSNPARRKIYDNDLKHAGQYSGFNKNQVNNSEQILKQSTDLLRYINSMQNRSTNHDALTDFILGILNKENMAILLRANSKAANELLTGNILEASKGILATRSFNEIAERLYQLHPEENDVFKEKITQQQQLRTEREQQNKFVPYAAMGIIFVIILIMCFILYFK